MNQVGRIFLAHKQVFRVFSEVKVDMVSHYEYREYTFIYVLEYKGQNNLFPWLSLYSRILPQPYSLDSSCFPVNLEIGDFIFLLILLSCISALIYKEERGGREGKQESNSRSRNMSCS